MPPLGRAGQSQAPLSCAAQGRHASRVASARTLGSTPTQICPRRAAKQPKTPGGSAPARKGPRLPAVECLLPRAGRALRGTTSGPEGGGVSSLVAPPAKASLFGQRRQRRRLWQRFAVRVSAAARPQTAHSSACRVARGASVATRRQRLQWSRTNRVARAAVLPNPSLKRRPATAGQLGRPPLVVYHASAGQAVMPPRSA